MVRTRETALVRLAGTQHGLAARAQSCDLGLDDDAVARLRRSGRWDETLPGVLRSLAAPRTWHQEVMAACLWGGPLAVASHRSAARLWNLDGDWGDVIEVTVQYAMTNERVEGPLVHRTRRLDPRDRSQAGLIPVTAVERTLVDLAALIDDEGLEIAMESAFRRQLTSMPRLWRRVDALTGRRGLRTLRHLLHLRQPEAAQSLWEAKLLRLIRSAGLPEPVRQHPAWDGETERMIDLAYPPPMIGLEYDSFRHHSGRRDWERTHTRFAGLTALGWRILPVTMADIDDYPRRTIARLSSLLSVCVPARG